MAEIRLVDTTVRDGHQSLWSANALSTSMLAEIAPVLDRVGFHAIDFTSSTHMAMAVRWQREDPWERIRVVRELMPETRLGFITPGMRFMAWWRAPEDVMELALDCVIRNGIRRVWVAESMNDVATDLQIAAIAKRRGAEEVVVGLVFSISPFHTDDYYAERARLPSRRARTSTCSTSRTPAACSPPSGCARSCRRLRRGGAGPAARGALAHDRDDGRSPRTSRRPARCVVRLHGGAAARERHVAALGGADGREPARRGLRRGARRRGARPRSRRTSCELAQPARSPGRASRSSTTCSVYKHQLPGGMTSTLRRQLAELGLQDRLRDILDELPRVREELGWPIMVTPLSQFVGVQAFLNVTTGERWSQVPDEVVRYVLGQYGPPAAEIDPDVRARVLGSPRAEALEHERHGIGLDAARERFGDDDHATSCSCCG